MIFDLSVDFPFDISDKLFEIRYNEDMDNDVSSTGRVEKGLGPYSVAANMSRTQSSELINTYYIYSYDGKLLEEYDHSGNCVKQYIYFGNRLLAEYQPQTNKYYYYMTDQINSTRIITDDNGDVVYSEAYGPFGDVQKTWTNTYDPKLKFSGKERETYSDLDYFGARYYDHKSYRFNSVDPVINREEALYNPQLWNLYSYTRNNPVTYFDPDGRYEVDGYADSMAMNFAEKNGADITDIIQLENKLKGIGAAIGLGAFVTPEIAVSFGPTLRKAVQQIYKFARIIKGNYKKALDYALHSNKMNHYFKTKHGLRSLIQKFGGRENLVKKVLDSLGKIKPDSRGVFDVVRKIGGMDVRITGKIQDGVIKIGNIMKN